MTTTVKIEAHCDEKTKVQVAITRGRSLETFALLDGESREVTIFDDHKVTVQEVDIDAVYSPGD